MLEDGRAQHVESAWFARLVEKWHIGDAQQWHQKHRCLHSAPEKEEEF